MTVEMEKPFVWPENPESWEPWGRKEKKDSVASSLAHQGVKSVYDRRNDAKTLRQQALNLLKKKGSVQKTKETKRDVESEGIKKVVGHQKSFMDKRAAQTAKPKKLDENILRRWEEQRTPQILSQELLDPSNYASLRQHKPKERASR